MRWYHLIPTYEAIEQPFVSDMEDLKGIEDWQLCQGKRIEQWDPGAWIKCSKDGTDGVPDDGLWNHLGVPIFSSALQRALTEAGIGGIQYLPVHVFRPDESEYFGYAIANILNLIPALDTKRSDFSVYPQDYFLPARRGLVSAIRKAVLREDCLRQTDIIRLKEFDVASYVSRSFVALYEMNRFTGYSFTEVQLS